MRNKIILAIFSLGLISCATNKYSYKDYKAITTKECSQLNFSQNKINRIDIPNIPQESPSPAQSGFKKIDGAINAYPDIGILKENKFIALYGDMNSRLLMGKIFDSSGDEIINRFKIVESEQNKSISYKLVTDSRLDYFLVFYLLKNGVNFEREFFVKKFDLSGNQIGSETKLDVDAETFSNVTYSFDQNGKNLILSWVDPITKYENKKDECPPFTSCNTTGPRGHNLSVIKYIKFDDNLNYCFNSIELDLTINNNNYGIAGLLHITKDREKIIFTVDSKSIKVLNLKNNQIQDISIDTKDDFSNVSKFTEDDKNYYFINRYLLPKGQGFSVYKLDKNFSIISSKNEEHIPEIKKISVEDIKVGDKIEILPKIFLDKNLSISKFYYSDTENQKPYYNLAKSTFRIDDKLLYINGDNFIIL